jgi:arylsulfatase A-like enzyme
MSRTEPGARRLALVALAALAAAAAACSRPEPPAQSLVVVTLDTVRRDHIGLYGDARGLTPQLDALGAQALVHDAAWTSMPTTGPAHVSLFTGLAPSEHGSRQNGDPMDAERAGASAAEQLRAAGFATAAFVSVGLAGARATGLRGFEIYDAPEAVRSGAETVRAALAWLEVERRRPLLLWVHLYDAHAPYGAAAEKRADPAGEPHGWVEAAAYTAAQRQELAARYARGVREADAALGALLEGVRARLSPPPLWVIASDHGECLDEHLAQRGYAWDHGELLDPESARIALLAAGPGVTPGRSPGTVTIADVHATLLRAAGLPASEGARDLRLPSAAARAVAIERRSFLRGTPAAARDHAAAAARGEELVVVGADGSPHEPAPPALLELARSALPRADEAAPELDPASLELLERLGYAE